MKSIFINGLGQNQASWDKTISYMDSQINTVSLDTFHLLNNVEIIYDNLYRSFSDFCNNISEPLNLCGLSLGGVLALNYVIDYPERVQKLVLIATQFKMPRSLLKIQNLIFRFMPKSSFKNVGFQKEDMIKLTNSMYELDFSDKLRSITSATLVVCGEKDNANIRASQELAEKIPLAKLQIIKNSKHEVNIDNPQKLALILDAFYLKQTNSNITIIE